MAARLHSDFLGLFDANALAEPGAYSVMGQPIDLAAITCDNFVVGAVTDHLTPWKSCYHSRRLLGGKNSTFVQSNGGHVAALVNPPGNPKAYHYLAPAKAEHADGWMETAERLPGSWWESWTRWAAERSGAMVGTPKSLGSKAYKPLCDAPGEYVKA